MKHVTGIGGIFFKAQDPEGNRIELWGPRGER
jgi:predicted enzyme related to lactoylglutathione lyase